MMFLIILIKYFERLNYVVLKMLISQYQFYTARQTMELLIFNNLNRI